MEPHSGDFRLLNDQPVLGASGRDILGTGTVAAQLAALIEASNDSTPFTLSIDAGWGMGKSSLMLQVQERLQASSGTSGVQTVWFNAWTAEGTQALDGLIKSVLLSLDENVLRRGLRRIVSRHQLMAALRVSFILVASFFHLARVVDELWSRISVDTPSRNNMRKQLAGLIGDWTARSKRTPNGRMLVVFIDDLDRCPNDVILQVFEAIKLYLDVPGIAFVLGCDQAVLGQAALRPDSKSQNVADSSYLEKIIQITYTKPTPFDDQAHELIDDLARQSGTLNYFSDTAKAILVEGTGRNPRRIKRLINSFVLEFTLDPGWDEFGAEALISILLLKQFYTDFYHIIANPATGDIATEFLTYLDIRARSHMGDIPTAEDRHFFASHQVRPPVDRYDAHDLSRLEEELPVTFPMLARDSGFASLLRSLSDRADFIDLRRRLQRHPISAIAPRLTAGQLGSWSDGRDLAGLRILWIDDDQAMVARERAAVIGLGGTVDTVSSAAQARTVLLERSPDVVIADLGRGGNDGDNLRELRELREAGGYVGPAIIYTDRVTPSRQRAAENLHARITSAPDVLLDYLRATPMPAGPIPGATADPRPEQPDPAGAWPRRKGLARADRWSSGDL